MFELIDNYSQNAVIKVIGVGGGGGNAVQSMLESKIHGADFIVANTDAQALADLKGATPVQIGEEITKGLGAGADPEIGRQAAEEDRDKIQEALVGSDMLFIAAGMGGGTGTGAAPVIAQLARDMGILTVAVVTKPFEFEGPERMKHAQEGIDNLKDWVDSLIVIPNSRLREVYGGEDSIFSSFENANDVLRGAVKGIAEIITIRGFINVDFADVRTVMAGRGKAMMGSGVARGDNRADEAVRSALSSPLLENIDLHGAGGVLVNITAGNDLSVSEFDIVGDKIRKIASDNATIITGCIKEEENNGELRVTIIATGFDHEDMSSLASMQESKSQDNVSPTPPTPSADIGELKEKEQVLPTQQIPSFAKTLSGLPSKETESSDAQHGDSLDIPAFLRQQAD
ncbi:MAG: cell division protein FtsZ [Pseudomonadota bacterium]|nr:cell division protein FtsZ [Pseudomonadota bacterium]